MTTIDMEQVTPNVFSTTKLRGCNPSFVVTSDGVVVIDTPQLPTRAVAMRAKAELNGPIRYLINTEHHVDHIFGNYWFKGVPVVNHQGLYDNFMDPNAELDPFAYALEAVPTDDPDAAGLIPDRDVYYVDPNKGSVVFTGRPDAAGRRPHVPLPVDARPYARPARGARAGGAGRVHRRHDLQRGPDMADDVRRRPVAGGVGADPATRRRSPRAGPRAGDDAQAVERQRAVLLAWKAAVADAVAKGWTREETVERVRFDDVFGPVDVGQGYMMDHIQNKNAGSLWDKFTALGYQKGR